VEQLVYKIAKNRLQVTCRPRKTLQAHKHIGILTKELTCAIYTTAEM